LFLFGRHWFSEIDRDNAEIGPGASLLVSEQRGDDRAKRLSEMPNCPLTLRELLVVNDKLARKRFDVAKGKDVYDLDIDPLIIAREFMQEVFLTRLT